MNRLAFYQGLLFVTALAVLVLCVLGLALPDWAVVMPLNWLVLLMLLIYCGLWYELSTWAVRRANPKLFGYLFLAGIGLKMLLSLGLLVWFMWSDMGYPALSPLSFMFVYGIYLLYSVVFMGKIARQQPA